LTGAFARRGDPVAASHETARVHQAAKHCWREVRETPVANRRMQPIAAPNPQSARADMPRYAAS